MDNNSQKTKEVETLSPPSTALIEEFLKLPIGVGVSCPYYNNRRQRVRAGLRALIGKGSVQDIVDEAAIISMREKKPLGALSADDLTKFLVDHHIGIDCSGFAYHVLDRESVGRGQKRMALRLAHPYATSIIRKLITFLRKVENTGVATFSHDSNSRVITLQNIRPGDFISINYDGLNSALDHMMIIERVEKEEGVIRKIQYIHAIAWSSDGLYGHGVRRGEIEVLDKDKSIIEQYWIERGKAGRENETLSRALSAKSCAIRRLNWF